MDHPLALVGTASDGYLDLDEIKWYNVPLTSEETVGETANGSETDRNWSCKETTERIDKGSWTLQLYS